MAIRYKYICEQETEATTMSTHTVKVCATLVLLTGLSFDVSKPAQAQTPETAASATAMTTNPFVKKRYSIKGEWSVVEVDGETQIRFSDKFKTKGGPDLKVFLTKSPIDNLDSETAAKGAVSIGVLKSKSGGQIYTLPDGVELSDYESVIIHCEAFSVLWGGFDLPKNPARTTSKP